MRFLWAAIIGFPGGVVIGAVRLYQIFLSPLLGRNCRFSPSCSHYFIQAVRKYGAVRGSLRGAWRIFRCNPFGGSGYDPP
jgi:putative membrane protein insertion efficiency factor